MEMEYGYTDIPYSNRKNIYLSDKFLSPSLLSGDIVKNWIN